MADIIAIAHKTIDCMNKKCADKGQVFVTESQTQEFNMENGKFTLFRTLFNEDINVLTYLNQKKGSYYSNKLEDSSIENAVDMALMSAQSGSEDEAYDIAPYQGDIYAIIDIHIIEVAIDMVTQFIIKLRRHYVADSILNIIIINITPGNRNAVHCHDVCRSLILISPRLWQA